MKKLAISLFCVLGLVATSCDDDRTLDDTRLQETEKPTLTLNEVTMEDSYTVTMSATLNTVGDPNVFEFGFIISPEENPTVENSTYVVADSVAANMTLEKTISIYTGGKLNARAYALTTAGITYSETTSLDMKRHPLYDWGITEQQALQYCYDHGFDWDGLYEHFDRVSCWLCPLQGIKELRTLRKLFPELWSKLRVMDALTYFKYRDDYSIEQLERRFALEDAQGCLFEVDEVVKNEK